ncbi:hypothetical protein GTW43_33160 [Streptomyces sp. SID5785]|uniref:hypothetical protein n=1 Tax=Streptomyces sp. SID5785 TaxID=2690309 RepID=UPI001361420A|nr:hypothetical protein [Streptomyces sp. SID5785]MZD09895.1 hypothetical protein [Streptomyces sp. SID5785]
MLPPSVIAGVPIVCAGGAWLSADPLVLRGVTAVAAAAAVVGAVVMRRWDRLAGKQVAELNRGAASERWRHEEAVAELEGDLDESRELRTRLENKLRAKRAELAGLRGEHAALLRRYANAETERASALEGRRRLAIESAAPARALPPAGTTTPAGGPTPSLYLRANAALDRLAGPAGQAAPVAPTAVEGADSRGKSRAVTGHYTVPAAATVVPAAPVRKALVGGFDFFGTGGAEAAAAPVRPAVPEDLADVVGEEALAADTGSVPDAATDVTEPRDAQEAAAAPDLSGDVATMDDVSDVADTDEAAEAVDAAEATDVADAEDAADEKPGTEVIDLTAHDETEQIDVADLRSALRA